MTKIELLQHLRQLVDDAGTRRWSISITRKMPSSMLAKTDKGTHCPALDGLAALSDDIETMLAELKEPQP